jgi:RNA polymerase sigma-70 factor (ECF subfamily)
MATVTTSKADREHLTQEFDELFREHYPLVYRSAFSVIFKAEDAEDVVQTVFLRILRNGLPAGVTNRKGYLYRAAVNEALNIVRSRRNLQNVSRSRFEAIADEGASEPEPSMSARIAEAMTQLNATAVEMLVLRYEHHYSDAEIARLLGKSRAVVAVTLFRARTRLKKLLSASSATKGDKS